MSENVKINIFEKDNTSPSGTGIDSTDIAFVPGFSALGTAPQNIPTLVTSVREFEKIFGSYPLVLTDKDVASYSSYKFKAGDYDRSYVYAKELLFQGMPVIYSNIVSANSYEGIEFIENSVMFDPNKAENYKCLTLISGSEKGKITITSNSDHTGDIDFKFGINVDIEGTDTDNSASTIIDFRIGGSNFEVKNCRCEIADEHKNLDIVELSPTQYDVRSKAAANKKFAFIVTIHVSLAKHESVDIIITESTKSVLDVFYDKNSEHHVNTQWAIPSIENPVDCTIADKSIYSVKYITSGGYPSVISADKSASDVFAKDMIKAAEHRGDAVALIDYQLDSDERIFTVGDNKSTYSKIHALFDNNSDGSYGTMMSPWAMYNCSSTLGNGSNLISMPASFGYLMCVAKAIKSSPNWLAMAGVSRGLVPGIKSLLVPGGVISNFIAEEMQPKYGAENHNISVNTITNIRPYGLTLWGNRTLKPVSKDGTVALNFLNTRNMLSDIKKLLYTTAKSCMFEQNGDDLWIKFKGGIEPLLRRLKAGNGISDYQIVRGTTKYNGDPLTKGEVAAVIKVYPMYAVEFFELAVEINDEDVTVS